LQRRRNNSLCLEKKPFGFFSLPKLVYLSYALVVVSSPEYSIYLASSNFGDFCLEKMDGLAERKEHGKN